MKNKVKSTRTRKTSIPKEQVENADLSNLPNLYRIKQKTQQSNAKYAVTMLE